MFKMLKNSFVSFVLILILAFFTTTTPSNVYAQEYSLTDYVTDIPYCISVSSDKVTITSSDSYDEFTAITPILSCCVYNGVFSFLSYTEENDNLFAYIYTYDILTKNFYSTSTILPIRSEESRFTVDSIGRLYLVDSSDDYCINRLSNGEVTAIIHCDSQVRQLLCLDGTTITIITNSGIFTTDNTSLVQVSKLSPDGSCHYTGNGCVTDLSGNIYQYKNGAIFTEEEEDEDDGKNEEETTAPLQTEPTSDRYTYGPVFKDNYLFVDYKTTVAVLRKTLGYTKDNFTAYKKNGKEYPQGKLGTGMTVLISDKQYTIIVLGEVTGEGNINQREIDILMDYYVGNCDLEPIQKIACDINGDGDFALRELYAIARVGWGHYDTVFQEKLTLPVS